MTPPTCAPGHDHPEGDWPNISTIIWNATDEFYDYVCRYKSYLIFKDFLANLEQTTVFIIAIVGLLGGVWTVATMTQPLFRTTDFLLFRLIGYLETIQMALVSLMNVVVYCNCDRSYFCTFFWAHVATTAANVCADAVDLIVLFVCIERSVACLLPQFFHLIHARPCYYTVAIWALTVPSLFTVFQAFELRIEYDPLQSRYADRPSKFAASVLYRTLVKLNTARFYATAFLIGVATVISVVGFRTMTRRKRLLNQAVRMSQLSGSVIPRKQQQKSLITSRTSSSVSSFKHRKSLRADNARKLKKRQRDLCCLQLCLAVPIILNHILYAVGNTNQFSNAIVGGRVFERNLTSTAAVNELSKARSFDYLRLATNLSNVLAHGLHFYLYVMFSMKVRHGFVALWRTGRRKLFRFGSSTSVVVTAAAGPPVVPLVPAVDVWSRRSDRRAS